jgi:hypothetical protein
LNNPFCSAKHQANKRPSRRSLFLPTNPPLIDLPSIVFGGSGKPLPATFDGGWMRVLHAIAAKLLMALIVLHVAAALWHHAVRRDGLLRRMGWRRER